MIWLLSAYRADSHAAWAAWLQRRVQPVDWRVLELPGRHFRWRIRGNPLSWWNRLPDEVPALIVATSMVDLATLRGLNPRVGRVPALCYFHENQFAYPPSAQQVNCIEPQMVQLYAALAADRILFNSDYNRGSFLRGVGELLARMPDAVPPGVVAALADRAEVLPVPVEPLAAAGARDPRLIVWNHRWDYDKAPELFADAMLDLAAAGVEFRLALLGPRPPRPPAALQRLRVTLSARIVADGRLERDAYARLLGRAGIVVSTARHEFQGLAIMEAVSAGCRPLVPDALCYPEQYADAYRYPAGDRDALCARLRRWLDADPPAPPDIGAWSAERLLPRWRDLLLGSASVDPSRRCDPG